MKLPPRHTFNAGEARYRLRAAFSFATQAAFPRLSKVASSSKTGGFAQSITTTKAMHRDNRSV
jgi:hypothetical protein